VAYQSEIELRVKIADKELRELERRTDQLVNRFASGVNPFGASGGRKVTAAQRRQEVNTQRQRLNFVKDAVEAENRLRETKAQKTQQTNLKRVRFLRDQRIKAARDVASAEKKLNAENLKAEKRAILERIKAEKKAVAERQKAEKKAAAERQKLEKAAATRRSKRRQGIATGFGFPLLFGGGPLQSLAGGIGGAFGGLGGSIAASAIVSQLEGFAQAATETGQALNSTGGALDLMREKSLFSSKAVEEQAAVLEEQGKVAELSALLTGELVDKIGNSGVEALQSLGTETDETTRLWAELTLQLQALIAGPLQGFLSLVNDFLGGITSRGRLRALREDLKGTQAGKELEARIEEIAPSRKTLIQGQADPRPGVLTSDQVKQLLTEFTPARPVTATIPITAADSRRFAVKGQKDTAGAKAARDEERLRQRLAALELERQKIIEISRFKDKITAAEAANDSQLAIRLQGEQKKAEIESKRLKDLVKATDQREIEAINIKAATEQLAQTREVERQLGEDQRKRQELFETTIEGLQHQLEMAEATSQAERDRLKIARELKKLDDKGFSDDQLGQAGGIMKRLAVAQQPLNAFIRKSTEDLNNLQKTAVEVSQGIGNAIGNSLTSGLQSLVTGAKSVKEVFADMLKSVADVLLKTAAEMIATYIAIGIAKAFAGLGGGGGGGGGLGGFEGTFGTSLQTTGFFAEGGFVDRPTNALIGEGGEPEYVIPESKMRESMARYSQGNRGASVIADSGDSETSSGGGTAVATPIDVRYSVERINSVDYVTADQFQRGMQSAAAQGAKQGEQSTLKRLQMSGSTRRRLGL
tara:strand:- start:944 stop:3394 length:2451 start_codon:yes stop_codon:yes gene_type:complete